MNRFTLTTDHQPPLTMVGCGILRKEIDFLIKKNRWNLQTHFLDSSLHNYLNRLSTELNQALDERESRGEKTLVMYGSCHPFMDDYLRQHQTCRTGGQNCIVMLLGYEEFMRELEKGAYFLLEDWALNWGPMITACFGRNQEVVRDIFHGAHSYILALKTPCNDDFTQAAETAANMVDLPLRWMDVNLDHLEAVVFAAIEQRLGMD